MFRRRWVRHILQQIEPPRREDISAQYWAELEQLMAQGEISPDIATAIERDMFEAASPGAARRLNDRAWQSVLNGRRGDLDRAIARATDGGD